MARANKTREDTNFQKKGVCVVSTPILEADLLVDGSVYAVLPDRSLIVSVLINVTTVSGTANATLDVLANGTVVADEIAVTVAGAIDDAVVPAAAYLATGGEIVVKAGAVTPADGALVGDLVVEYIELDKNTGEYTVLLES